MKRAFSLLEVLVAVALTALALLLFAQILLPLARSSRTAIQRQELSQLAFLISQRVLADLQSCTPGAITLPDSPTGDTQSFSVQPLVQVGVSGKPIFSDTLWLYRVDLRRGTLERKAHRPVGLRIDQPTRWTPQQLESFWQTSATDSRRLVAGVLTQWTLRCLHPQRPAQLQCRFQLTQGSQNYTFDEVVALRNGGL